MKKIFITTAALLIACTLSAADLFVSPEGNDRNPGTKDSPKATLTAALRQARELRRLNDESVKGGITIHLEAGDYHLYEPVFIRPEDSGTESFTYRHHFGWKCRSEWWGGNQELEEARKVVGSRCPYV